MTIKLLAGYRKFASNTIVTLASATETALLSGGFATADLTGGVPYIPTIPGNTLSTPHLVTAPDGVPLGLADASGKILVPLSGIAAPGVPTGLTLTAMAGAVLASFTAPANTGGTVILGYEVTLSNGTVQIGEATTVVVPAPAGAAVTATVKSINGFDKSAASAVSNSVTPTGVVVPTIPSAPTVGTASAGNATVSAPYTAGSTGNSAITSYDAFLYAAGAQVAALTNVPNPVVFAAAQGVVNGTAYTVKVRANNAVGAGPLSAASNAVTPSSVPANIYNGPGTNEVGTNPFYTNRIAMRNSKRVALTVQNTNATSSIDITTNTRANNDYTWPGDNDPSPGIIAYGQTIPPGQQAILTADIGQVYVRATSIQSASLSAAGTTVTATFSGGHKLTAAQIAAGQKIDFFFASPSAYNVSGVTPTYVDDNTLTWTAASAPGGAGTAQGRLAQTGLTCTVFEESTP